MTELVPLNENELNENDTSMIAKLDVAKRALAEATEDCQRIDIRDYARAIAAATAILKRKDIQVQAANLVQDAERAIVKANPPMTHKERLAKANATRKRKQKGFISPQETNEEKPIKPNELEKMRQTHRHISDEEFEAIKAEAIKTGVPLTRNTLLYLSASKSRVPKSNISMDAYLVIEHLVIHRYMTFKDMRDILSWEKPKTGYTVKIFERISRTTKLLEDKQKLEDKRKEAIPYIHAFVFYTDTGLCPPWVCKNIFGLAENEQPTPKQIAEYAARINAYPKWDEVLQVFRKEAFEAS